MCIGTRFDDRSSSSWHTGLFLEFPEHETAAGRSSIRPNSAAIIRRRWGSSPTRRTFLRQLLAALARNGTTIRRDEFAGWRARSRNGRRNGKNSSGRISACDHHADAARTRRRAIPGRCCRTMSSCRSTRRAPQLVHAVLEPAKRADDAQLLGLFRRWASASAACSARKLAAPDRPCVAVVGDGGFTMVPHVLSHRGRIQHPGASGSIWNNFAWGAIRDIQYGMFDGREHGTAFYKGNRGPEANVQSGFRGLGARLRGDDGVTVTRSEDIRGAVETAVKNRRPCVIDVHVDSGVRPPSTGTWELPPIPYKEPMFGRP